MLINTHEKSTCSQNKTGKSLNALKHEAQVMSATSHLIEFSGAE